MESTDILCASDLSEAATEALYQALNLAERVNARVKLLHVLEHGEDRTARHAALEGQIAELNGGALADIVLLEGDPLDTIAEESGRGHGMLTVGTHGAKGIRQKIFGADILKLVRRVRIPSIVVQKGMARRPGIDHIVMPVAAHEDIDRLLDAVIGLARVHAAEVQVFQLQRPGEEPSEPLLMNKRRMLARLANAGVRHKEVEQPATSYSIGFANQTIEHAHTVKADLIAIMSKASDEYRYMADAEKERMLMNQYSIPVLCV